MSCLRLLLVCLCLLAASALPRPALAQAPGGPNPFEERELDTDRDAFTPATSTVGRSLTIVESSYSFIDNLRVAETHSFPELLVRHGLTEPFELRVGFNYEVGGEGDIVSGNDGDDDFFGGIKSEATILYGFKTVVTEQGDWLPRSAAIIEAFTPTSGQVLATDLAATYTAGWELPIGWRFDSALRYGTVHGARDDFNQWTPSTVLRMPLNELWHVHVEYFGVYTTGAERSLSRAYFSPGMNYMVTRNLEVGLRLGWALTRDTSPFFTNVGFGWRF